MAPNENVIKGKWMEIKGELLKSWGKLTDDELEQTKGDSKAIAGLIVQRYGKKQEEAHDLLSQIFRKYEDKKDHAVESIKNSLK
jgi:uncharacterized protein YjbJ (UPF0337 family)